MALLKFLVDVGVGRRVEEWLHASGYDVKAVRSIDPHSKDKDILATAVTESRMVITMDKDFGELVHNSGQEHTGVLILRLEDATGDEKSEVLKKILAKYADKLPNAFCVYQDGRLRIRE